MKTIEIITREVVYVHPSISVSEAARVMRDRHVGSVVVVEETDSGRIPVGLLTDRDIAIAVVAHDHDASTMRVADVMTRDLVMARAEDSVTDALRLMRSRGVRRLPVTTSQGMLAGIVTLDDLLEAVADEIAGLVQTIKAERSREGRERATAAPV